MCYLYRRDEAQIREWVQAFNEVETTQAYLQKYIYSTGDHKEYLEMIGEERFSRLCKGISDD